MQKRWSFFLSLSVPFLSRMFREYSAGTILDNEVELAEQARYIQVYGIPCYQHVLSAS